MNRRLTIVLVSCGFFVAVGVGAPIALGHDLGNSSLINALHAIAALGFMVGVVGLLQSAGDPASAGDAVYQAPPPAPRVLDSDPLGANADHVPLATRIDAAVEASRRYSRSIGVLYFNLAAYRQVAITHGAPAAEAAMDFIVAMLRTRLRNTDRIERVGRGRIAVCIVLLPEKQALLSIRDRLARAMQDIRIEDLGGAPIEFDAGLSIYPMHGYTGEDLIAHAQGECDAARQSQMRPEAARLLPTGRRSEAAA